jgi:hypothetical protein
MAAEACHVPKKASSPTADQRSSMYTQCKPTQRRAQHCILMSSLGSSCSSCCTDQCLHTMLPAQCCLSTIPVLRLLPAALRAHHPPNTHPSHAIAPPQAHPGGSVTLQWPCMEVQLCGCCCWCCDCCGCAWIRLCLGPALPATSFISAVIPPPPVDEASETGSPPTATVLPHRRPTLARPLELC